MRVGLGVVLLTCGACDSVFGLSGDPGPCGAASFDTAKPVDLAAADDFSISRDRTLAVLQLDGHAFELHLPGGDPMPIDLGPYVNQGFSLAPEGTSLFYTASIEPPTLQGALRDRTATWQMHATVPRGTYAGTPSADEFGPRRVLVRVRPTDPTIQEFEDEAGVWTPIGDPQPVGGSVAPNLTPSGLTMVFTAIDATTGMSAVFSASRPSTTEPFGDPVAILAGEHRSPQLLGACRELYVVDQPQTLRRYDQR